MRRIKQFFILSACKGYAFGEFMHESGTAGGKKILAAALKLLLGSYDERKWQILVERHSFQIFC